MASDFKLCTCAVCLINKGIRSKSLTPITPSVREKIQEYIWPNFDSDLEVCPSVVCSNCRRNLFSLNKGETAYLFNWLETISKVNRSTIRRTSSLLCIQTNVEPELNILNVTEKICGLCYLNLGRGVSHDCCKSKAVNNITDISESLGYKNPEQVASGLLKRKMERENIVSGEQFMLSTGGNLLTVTVGVNENKLRRKKVNQISFQTIMELSNVLELPKNKTKKLCSTFWRNLTDVESNINVKMTELQETLDTLYECKIDELFDGDQVVVRDIVYVKNTTEFIKFIIEDRSIDIHNSIVRISIDGGQNFLKVIINVFDPKNHYSSSEKYDDSGAKHCYILGIVEMVSEDNGNLQKLLASLKLEEVNFGLAFDLKCANSVFGLSSHYILIRGYHVVGLDGNNANRFMSLLDFWRGMLP